MAATRPGIKPQAPGHRLPVPAGRRFGEARRAFVRAHSRCTIKWDGSPSGSPPHGQAMALNCYRNASVFQSHTFIPPWAIAGPCPFHGSPVALASGGSEVTSPTRQPRNRAFSVSPSVP